MQFDVAIIGNGLAGLSCAISLAEQGLKSVIVAGGQSTLHFSSGSLDLLNSLPDGKPVYSPLLALPQLSQQSIHHPYSIIGDSNVVRHALEAEKLLQRSGIKLFGHSKQNHYRLSPLGGLRTTWLSHCDIYTQDLFVNPDKKTLLVLGIEGLLDFQPQLIAQQSGLTIDYDYLLLPCLDRLRQKSTEFRSTSISHLLDKTDNLSVLADEINAKLIKHPADEVILPACIGLSNREAVEQLQKLVIKPLKLLPTLPPSIIGIDIGRQLENYYKQLGGVIMPGDKVIAADLIKQQINAIYTRNHGDIPIIAKSFVLASGSFFSHGLVADYNRVYEPILGLDVDYKSDRQQWTDKQFFSSQAYLNFGVTINNHCLAQINQQPINNLYAVGSIVANGNALKLGCGGGVALTTALHAAEHIISGENQ